MPALDVPLDDARACFETNFFAIIAITQAFVPLLIPAKGLIINIGSVAAIVPYIFGSVYVASKAALHAYSRTLRLELEPFDVRVMVVVTGGVQSNIARTHRILPDDSLYLPILEDFERRQKHGQEAAMPHDVYARGVVDAALKNRPVKWLWRGHKAFLVKLVSSVGYWDKPPSCTSGANFKIMQFLGMWALDWALSKTFGLDKLKALVKGKAKNV
jgi:1-acylglycerone phosphate reductase